MMKHPTILYRLAGMRAELVLLRLGWQTERYQTWCSLTDCDPKNPQSKQVYAAHLREKVEELRDDYAEHASDQLPS